MNNNYLSLSQNLYNSYPLQFSPNLNYIYYFMPDKQIYVPNYNFYQIVTFPCLQNNLQYLNNTNNNKNETPINYNYSYNNIINPLNTLEFNSQFPSEINTQINVGESTPTPPQNNIFLNKKRSSTVLYEKENEKINVKVKTEEQILQIKEVPKINNKTDIKNNETTKKTSEITCIKEVNNEQKQEINKEENEKENLIITSLNCEKDKEEKKVEKKKGKKKKRNYSELLQDTLLEHIGEPKKKTVLSESAQSTIITKESINKIDMKSKNKSCKINNTSIIPIDIDEKQNDEKENKEKNNKIKIKNQRHQKKKQHKKTIKNNNDLLADLQKDNLKENEESNPKFTKVIFHGTNYENTKSMIDFMKYNFNFNIDEQYKSRKLITDYEQQHIDILKIKQNVYDNYNSNDENLEKIEQKWSRKKFVGDNKELKKAINIISDSFPGRKTDINEEKCLNILKNNDYNIKKFSNSNQKKL